MFVFSGRFIACGLNVASPTGLVVCIGDACKKKEILPTSCGSPPAFAHLPQFLLFQKESERKERRRSNEKEKKRTRGRDSVLNL